MCSPNLHGTSILFIGIIKITHFHTVWWQLWQAMAGCWGSVLFYLLLLVGVQGSFPTLPPPSTEYHTLPYSSTKAQAPFLGFLNRRVHSSLLSALLGSPSRECGTAGGEDRTHPGLGPGQNVSPEPCGWGTVGVGTSDFLGLGSFRASFASSHPLPFTPGLFYCFITFFKASVAKDSDGAILHFLTLPNPKSCCFKQFGHLQRLSFQI